MSAARHELGRRAEEAAAGWLTAAGWQVLARRWRGAGGELDLVCSDPSGALVGIEVRARRSARAGSPLESLDRRALLRRRSALGRYAVDQPLRPTALRLDLVTATPLADGRWSLHRYAAIDAW
jgi:putative endonuclease